MKMLNELVLMLMPTLCLYSAQSVLMLMLMLVMAREVSIVMVRMEVVIMRIWKDDDSDEDYDKKKYRKTGASNHVGPVKVQPPFINPMIEILVAAKVSFLLSFSPIIQHSFF